jgi:L-fuconolactonase
VAGVRTAGAAGLAVDLVLFSASLPAVIDLVDACLDTQFVLDHCGKPRIREGLFEPWASTLRELALRTHVTCKLSGLATEADHERWTIDTLRPYVEHVIECFGAERILYASDWPLTELAGGAQRWLDAVKELTASLDKDARAAVFSANARRVYGV